MALMEWNENFVLHIAAIDSQHQKLVGLVNDFAEALGAGEKGEILSNLLGELLDYTKTHFAYEEQLLADYAYPAYPGHKEEHDALAEKVVFMNQMLAQGESLPPDILMAFLRNWLQEHILENDKRYSSFLRERGAA